MRKIVRPIYLKLYGFYYEYKKLGKIESYEKSLLSRYSKVLFFYEENVDSDLEKFFPCVEEILPSLEDKMLFIIMFHYNKEKIIDTEINILICLIQSLEKTRVNAYKLEYYVDMFLDKDVYMLLLELNSYVPLPVLIDLMETLIGLISFEDVQKRDYRELLASLHKVNSTEFSYFFHGDFSLENICNVLMGIIRQYKNYFTIDDEKTIQDFLEVYNNLSNDDRCFFQAKMKNLESKFFKDPVVLGKVMLMQLRLFKDFSSQGLNIILNRKVRDCTLTW